MNPVLILARNNRALTADAIESVRKQTIPTEIFVTNNGSEDGTHAYLNSLFRTYRNLHVIHHYPGWGVAASWNETLRSLFGPCCKESTEYEGSGHNVKCDGGVDHCLVINNDVILRPDTYSALLAHGGPFVTAVGVRGEERQPGSKVFYDNKGEEVFPGGTIVNLDRSRPHPDYSCWLMRKSVWEVVGEFDEGFKGAYAEDADHHVRMHKAGIEAVCIDLPFYHYGAATIKGVPTDTAEKISEQANANRAYFKSKWGVEVGSTAYYHDLFGTDAPEDTHFGA